MKMEKPIKFSNLKKSQKGQSFSNLEEYQQSWDFDFFKFFEKPCKKCQIFTKMENIVTGYGEDKNEKSKIKISSKMSNFQFCHFDILTFLKWTFLSKVNLMFFATLHILGRKHV